jgi:hypothetical protein
MFRTQRIHLMGMFGAIALTVAILSTAIIMTSPSVDSSASDNLSGFAWSETIGWISFNSTNEASSTAPYGVKVATNGDLSGYAWSENIGWISFNPGDVSGCPSGTCAPSLDRSNGVNKGVVSGWARALSPTSGVNTGGWDGWISLDCANNGACATSDYKVKATDCSWGGFAWGGDVVGWISFSGAHGGNVTGTGEGCHPIQYSCEGTAPTDATACSAADPGVSGVPYGVVGATVSSCLLGATKCHYYCNNGYTQSGNACVPTQCNDAVDNDADGKNNFGVDPGCSSINDDNETDELPVLTVTPMTVLGGSNANFAWDLKGNIGCTLTGGNRNFDLTPPTVSSTSPIYARTTFTLTCPAGSDTATVDIVPIGTET